MDIAPQDAVGKEYDKPRWEHSALSSKMQNVQKNYKGSHRHYQQIILVWSIFLRIPWSGQVFGLSLTILSAPGAGLWLPGNPFPLLEGSWGDCGCAGAALSHAAAALKPKRAASDTCWVCGPCLCIRRDAPALKTKAQNERHIVQDWLLHGERTPGRGSSCS